MLAIVGFSNLNLMQFLLKYTRVLDEHNISYDVIYWDRNQTDETCNFKGNPICYHYPMNSYQPFHKKIFGFVKYSLFLRKQLSGKKYDKVIVLTTQAAIPLYDILLRKYKEKFIYDYRDITKEKQFSVYAKMVRNLVKASAYTMISSKGFLSEIGLVDCQNIITAHNTWEPLKSNDYHISISPDEPIRLVFWGMVRQVEHNKKICDALGNDHRFTLTYHGEGFYRELEQYCNEKGYKNIVFTGRYNLQDIPEFIDSTDILHCIYENDTTQKNAMPVKPYDAIRFKLPMVVSKGSYLEKYFESCVGVCTIDPLDLSEAANQLYDWYKTLDKDETEKDYLALQEKICKEDLNFDEHTMKFVET